MTGPAPIAGPESSGAEERPGFWDFSLAVYADPATAAACLELQNRFDLDVNLLLFCVFAGCNGRRLSVDELSRLDAAVHPWRTQVIHPLRAARRWIKSADAGAEAEAVRRQVLNTELAAERHQQVGMEQMLPIAPGPIDLAACTANLLSYTAALGRQPEADLHGALTTLCTLSTETAQRRRGARSAAG